MSAQPPIQAPAGAMRAEDHAPPRRTVGLAAVVLLHLVLGYALVSGLGRQAMEAVKRPLQATIVEEAKAPPPPPPPPAPPPPKPISRAEPPPTAAPPPFVPAPEAPVPSAQALPLAAVVNSPPVDPVVIAPPAPAAPPLPASPERMDLGVACPHQVQPQIPERALRDGIGGIVRVQVRIREDRVQEVQILSGPKVFHEAVRKALLQYGCKVPSGGEVSAVQEIRFDLQ